jgi:hypothetical protein
LISRSASVVLAASAVGVGLHAGTAGAAKLREFRPASFLLSRSVSGAHPNGPSCCGVVSHDERIGRVMAFESTATDIARPVRRGVANVYAVFRKPPWKVNGSPWVPGETKLISRGLHARAANGPSYAPALSGDSAHVPRCIGFLSRASNLVRGDRNRRADAFLADLRTGHITRVSVGSRGQEGKGTTSEVSVDGGCRRVAFVSTATNLVAGSSRWRGARVMRLRSSGAQVYVRFLGGPRAADKALAGLTLLASAHAGSAADSPSDQVDLSRNGRAVAFVSAAGNLGVASGGRPQVWERTISAKPRRGGVALRLATRLVSATPVGVGGNGASMQPSIDHNGLHVAFETLATDLVGGPVSRTSQIARATLAGGPPQIQWISKNRRDVAPGNGPSHNASISDGGQWIFFDSFATNLGVPGNVPIPRLQRQVYRWSTPELTTYADLSGVQVKSLSTNFVPSRSPAENPQMSARGNYVPFESEDPDIDPYALPRAPEWLRRARSALSKRLLADETLRPIAPRALRALPGANGPVQQPPPWGYDGAADRRLHQVYVRYLGPQ